MFDWSVKIADIKVREKSGNLDILTMCELQPCYHKPDITVWVLLS